MNIFYNFDLKKNASLKNYKIDNIKNKNIKINLNDKSLIVYILFLYIS